MNWESDIIAMLYDDMMNVHRQTQITDEDTGIMSEATMQEVYSNIKCGLSYRNKDLAKDNVMSEYTVFCSEDINIQPKDVLEVTHQGRIIELEAGVPYYYVSHTEIPANKTERL